MDIDGERCARPNYLSSERGHCFRRGEKAGRADEKIPRQNDSNFARFASNRFCLLHKNASRHTGERLGKNWVFQSWVDQESIIEPVFVAYAEKSLKATRENREEKTHTVVRHADLKR